MEEDYLIKVKDLKEHFKINDDFIIKAVDGVSFGIKKNEIFGLVGESGCGKTTCGRTCVVVYEVADGEVLYKGRNIHKMSNAEKKEFTKHVQMSFQDSYSSLDSRLKVHDIIVEGMRIQKLVGSKEEEYSGSVVKVKM